MQDEHAISRVGHRLRAAIKARGESLRSFADRANIPYRSLQDYVAGKNKPGFEQLQKLAAVGLDTGYLLTGTYSSDFLKTFALGARSSSLLSSDAEMAQLIYDGVVAAIDQMNRERFGSGGEPLPVKQILELMSHGLVMAMAITTEMDSVLSDLRQRGVSAATATGIVLEAVAKKLRAMAAAKLESTVPQPG